MGVERENAREAFRLIRKEPPGQFGLVLGLYALSCKERELGKVARSSYFFMRHMDDLLDGDMKTGVNPLPYALEVRRQIETDDFPGTPSISTLADYSIRTLNSRSREGDNPRKDFLTEIDSIIFDHERSKERRVLAEVELDEYYWRTFSPVVNILLIGLKSQLRAKDIPALSISQGRLYTIRDLGTDWQRGIINIPQEVLNTAGLNRNSSIEQLRQNQLLQDWFRKQAAISKEELIPLQKQIKETGEGLTLAICNHLIRWMIDFSHKQTS